MDLNHINIALKNDPLNAKLHDRSALAYESSSVSGTERREVPRVAYAMALKAEATFWPAQVQLVAGASGDAWIRCPGDAPWQPEVLPDGCASSGPGESHVNVAGVSRCQ
jgi:hypothetical protein